MVEVSAASGSDERNDIESDFIRCSTPLHLPPSPLEFSVIKETEGSLFDDDDTSSGENDVLFEGSAMTLEAFRIFFVEFAVRHKLPDCAMKELLKFFRLVLLQPNIVPNDFKHRRAKNNVDGFEVLDVRNQLSRIVERNQMAFSNVDTLTLFLNTDGASSFRSAKQSFWPFWAIVDNLPNAQRTSLKNMMLLALWKGNFT